MIPFELEEKEKKKLAFHGRIVANNLPPGHTVEQIQKYKPEKRAVDPHSLLAGSGPFQYRATPKTTTKTQGQDDEQATSAATMKELNNHVTTTTTSEQQQQQQHHERWTTLALYLYGEYVPPTASSPKIIPAAAAVAADQAAAALFLQLNRHSEEIMENTLKRLKLNLDKRFQKKKQKGIPPPPQQQQQQNNNNKEEEEEETSRCRSFAVYKVAAKPLSDDDQEGHNTNNLEYWGEPWDECLNWENQKVWQEAAKNQQQSFAIGMDLQISCRHSAATIMRRCNFLVEVNAPTVTAVQVFGDMQASLFVGVPVLVSTQSLFSDHVQVDWYCSGHPNQQQQLLVQTNNPCYIPRPSDVGKCLSILITPKRTKLTTETATTNLHNGFGCQEAYEFQNVVEQCPENRILSFRSGGGWTTTTAKHPNQNYGTNHPIRVVTYNILADQNAFDHGRPPQKAQNQQVAAAYDSYVTTEIMDKKRRLPLILHELLAYHPDIMCLQEVDGHIFTSLLDPVLTHLGYQGFFSSKQTAAAATARKTELGKTNGGVNNNNPTNNNNNEGCAMFWSLNRFQQIPKKDLSTQCTYVIRDLFPKSLAEWELQEDSQEWESMKDILSILEKYPDLGKAVRGQLGHVAQIVPLTLTIAPPCQETKEQQQQEKRTLIVSNTHLYFHPNGSHIRAMQAYAMAYQLHQIQKQTTTSAMESTMTPNTTSTSTPIVFCGDLNSGLRDAGGLLLVNGSVANGTEKLQRHFKIFRYEDVDSDDECHGQHNGTEDDASDVTCLPSNGDIITDNFPCIRLPESFPKLTSALDEYPPVTHYIEHFCGTLDHILLSKDLLVAVGNAPMPTIEYLSQDTAMPSPTLPSDHVSVVADFTFANDNNKKKSDDQQ